MPYANVNDIRMYFEEIGAGPPLVLLHGATDGLDAMSGWPALAPKLAEHFHVFLLEHWGHGRTDNSSGSMSYALIAEDLASFLDQFELAPAHVAAVSDRASIGLALALARPALLRSLTRVGANIYLEDQLREAMEFFDRDVIEQHYPEYATLFAGRHDQPHYSGDWRDLVRQVRSNVEAEFVWTRNDP
jgi:pimeloyl-ACP methyl ester carboxylesterase